MKRDIKVILKSVNRCQHFRADPQLIQFLFHYLHKMLPNFLLTNSPANQQALQSNLNQQGFSSSWNAINHRQVDRNDVQCQAPFRISILARKFPISLAEFSQLNYTFRAKSREKTRWQGNWVSIHADYFHHRIKVERERCVIRTSSMARKMLFDCLVSVRG